LASAGRTEFSNIGFEADEPKQTWRSESTHGSLTSGSCIGAGTGTEIITRLEDHPRLAIQGPHTPRLTGQIVLTTFREKRKARTAIRVRARDARTALLPRMAYRGRVAPAS
jgi:hypothetical protein